MRALCQVVTNEGASTGMLEVVIAVKEFEAAQIDQERAAKEARELAKGRVATPKPAPKKIRYTNAQLAEIYGDALRYYHGRLSEANAQFLAGQIIAVSRKYGLDARLVVAVVANEGTLSRVLFNERGAYIGNQSARASLATLAVDLSKRFNRGKSQQDSQERILRGLAARRRDLGPKGSVSRATVEAYVNRIARHYRRMCGFDDDVDAVFYSEAPDYEARWRARRWSRPPSRLVGTWEAAAGTIIVVINSDGSGVLGLVGEDSGRWFENGGYLEFREPGYEPRRFRWKVSDDRKALTLTRIEADSTPISSFTLLRR